MAVAAIYPVPRPRRLKQGRASVELVLPMVNEICTVKEKTSSCKIRRLCIPFHAMHAVKIGEGEETNKGSGDDRPSIFQAVNPFSIECIC